MIIIRLTLRGLMIRNTNEKDVEPGDCVIIKQNKTSVKPPFDPVPYEVVEVCGNQATITRGGRKKKRSFNKLRW